MHFGPAALAISAAILLPPAEAAPGNLSRISLGHDGLPGVHETFSSLPLQYGEFILGFSGSGHSDPSVITLRPQGFARTAGPSEALLLSARTFLSIGLGHGLDGALGLPFYYEYFTGDDLGLFRARGQGDLLLSLKGVIPWSRPWIKFSALLTGSVPVASGEGSFPRELIHLPPEGGFPSPSTWPFGTVDPRFGLGLGATLAFPGWRGPVLAHVNLMGERPLAPGDMEALGLLRLGLAAETPLSNRASLQVSLLRELLAADPVDRSADLGQALLLTSGISWAPASWAAVRFGMRFAPEDGNLPVSFQREGQPWTYRPHAPAEVFLAASLQGFPLRWDRDGDGHPDSRDRCPRRAEDLDGFEDSDGCPELDNDRDGFVDSLDRCPGVPEDRDGFKDWDGCPDQDNDVDGVEDLRDACGNDAEDKDGFEDSDGCPDLDDDRDGITDAADRCPRAAETRNGFEDADGCPESDADGDGKPDKSDKCPREAEIVNFFEDADGCPDEKPAPVRDGILPGVAFLSGNAELLPSSYASLDSLARLLTVYPGTEIEIQGHLDDRAGSGSLGLAQARARAVAAYLAGKGVEARRMKPVGYGSSRPIDNNRTAKGREANRRIEIRRLN